MASATPTHTPLPDVSGPGGCAFNAAFIADITIPDDTELAPGQVFRKTWRVRNSGSCAWEAGTKLVFVSGAALSAVHAVDAPQAEVGASVDLSVDMVAPATPGTHRSIWQLRGPDGSLFGAPIYVQIRVPAPATATPTITLTPTPTGSPTPGPSPTPSAPDLVITDLRLDTDIPRQGVTLHIVVTLRNLGGKAAENFHWAWRTCVETGCSYTEAPGSFTLKPGESVVTQVEYKFEGWANYTLEAWVDSRQAVTEHDEKNNTYRRVVAVQPGDLNQ